MSAITGVYSDIANFVNSYADDVSVSNFSYSINSNDINIQAFSLNPTSISGVSVPNRVLVQPSIPTMPTPQGPTPSPLSASFTDNYADIAAISLSDVSSTLYKGYTLPESLPTPDSVTPDLSYPEAGFISVKESAGLSNLVAPDLVIGTRPEFLAIPDVSFDLTPLETLSITLPDVPELPDITQLSNPEYLMRTLSPELEQALENAVAGNVILSAETQQNILDIELRKINKNYDRKERQIFEQVSAQGFSSMTGPGLSALSELEYDTNEAETDNYFAMRQEVHTRAIKQVQEGIKQQLRLESANLGIHLQYASHLMETLKFNVAQREIYANLLIEMFNSQLGAVQEVVRSYESYVRATLAQFKVQEAEINRERAVLETNAAKLTAYNAQIETAQTQADVYSTEAKAASQGLEEYSLYVQALLKNIDIARINIKSFGESNRAYSAAIDTNKDKISAYAAQVRATGSATGVYEANWDSYSQAQSSLSSTNDARRDWYQASIQNLRGDIDRLTSAAGAQRSYYSTLSNWSRGNASLANQHEGTTRGLAEAVREVNRLKVDYNKASVDIALAESAQSSTESQIAVQTKALEESINVGLLAAQATTASGSAQAANSIKSISAGVSASAGLKSNRSNGKTAQKQSRVSRGKSYSKVLTASI